MNTFKATNITQTLATKGAQATICHTFESIGPQYQAMPRFLEEINYDVTNSTRTVFQEAWKSDETPFQWFSHEPEKLEFFNQCMAARRSADQTWLSVFPVEEYTKGWDPKAPVYVDIGGSIGHQCAQFKSKYPGVVGRVILQDLPQTIEHALQTPEVENMAHDFFQPQPVKGQSQALFMPGVMANTISGAKFYYLRAVLHDFPDEKARLILQNTMAAMGSESVILVDEMVLPVMGVNSTARSLDLTMMCAFNSMERTEPQWEALFDSVGLNMVRKMVYNPGVYESVMVVVRK